jgi:diguanylate cyclase (GGDEF)-like protein
MTQRRRPKLVPEPVPKTAPDFAWVAARLGARADDLGPTATAAVAALFRRIDELEAALAEAEGLADRDALTPLFNRRALVRELTRALAFAERYGAPASLAYFDVDGLKAVNDRLGHAMGDAVLQRVAERLLSSVRASDAVARMGGDEFAVLLVQTDGFQAEAKAAQLAAAVAEPLGLRGGPASVSVSWGVAEVRPGIDAEALIAEADAAMYAEKKSRQRDR